MQRLKKVVNNTTTRLNNGLSELSDMIQRIVRFLFIISTIGWASVFIYISIYLYYIPVVYQEKPVYFRFRVCENGVGICSFPTANISLGKDGKNKEVFKIGQSYKIVLEMAVPETDVNRNLGMFMIEIRMYNRKQEVVQMSARATSLNYKSELLRVIETFVFSPLFLFEYMQQRQQLHIELFPDFMDNTYNPSVGLVIEIQSKAIELYVATLKVFAQFSGIRYFLYYWPTTSAIIGISTIFSSLLTFVLLSWYWPPWKQDVRRTVINMPWKRKTDSPKKKASKTKAAPDTKSKTLAKTETVGGASIDEDDQLYDEETLLSAGESSKVDSGLRLRASRIGDMDE